MPIKICEFITISYKSLNEFKSEFMCKHTSNWNNKYDIQMNEKIRLIFLIDIYQTIFNLKFKYANYSSDSFIERFQLSNICSRQKIKQHKSIKFTFVNENKFHTKKIPNLHTHEKQ